MQLVNPGAGICDAYEPARRLLGHEAEYVHPQRKIGGRKYANAGSFDNRATHCLIALPAGGADDHVPTALGQTLEITLHRRRDGKIDGDINLAEIPRLDLIRR